MTEAIPITSVMKPPMPAPVLNQSARKSERFFPLTFRRPTHYSKRP